MLLYEPRAAAGLLLCPPVNVCLCRVCERGNWVFEGCVGVVGVASPQADGEATGASIFRTIFQERERPATPTSSSSTTEGTEKGSSKDSGGSHNSMTNYEYLFRSEELWKWVDSFFCPARVATVVVGT